METQPNTLDKTQWGEGPWQHEPDTKNWTDPVTGYKCHIARNPVGSLCGYVQIPKDHPWHGRDYDGETDEEDNRDPNSPNAQLDTHHGLTWSENYPGGLDEPEDLNGWWFGFDCSHMGDISPQLEALHQKLAAEDPRVQKILEDKQASYERFPEMRATYKTIEYVENECANLAKQLNEIQRKPK